MTDIPPKHPSPSGEPPAATPDEVPTSNPLEGLGVSVSLPDLEVRMVNAFALEDYEIWFGSTSILAAAAVGFFAAYVSSTVADSNGHGTHHNGTFLLVTVLFVVLTVGAAVRTCIVRNRLKKKSRSYQMRVTSQ